MHKIKIAPWVADLVKERTGKVHPFDSLDARRTALVVIDLQNYFMKGTAFGIVPAVNRLASALRDRGGHVVWVRNGTEGTLKSWSVKHDYLKNPKLRKIHYEEMRTKGDGFKYWHELDMRPGDGKLAKKRFSAFIQGSSPLEKYLRSRKIDTILVTGTATNVCCESTARDAMMLNFKVVMVSDALAARSDEVHNASLSAFYMNFGDVQTVDEVLASFDRVAGAKPKNWRGARRVLRRTPLSKASASL